MTEENTDTFEIIFDEERQENIVFKFPHGKRVFYNGIEIEEIRDKKNGWKTVREANVKSDVGIKYTTQEVRTLMKQYGLLGHFDDIDTQTTIWGKIRRFLITLMQRDETYIRSAMFIDQLKKGDTPEQAAVYVHKCLFDYVKK